MSSPLEAHAALPAELDFLLLGRLEVRRDGTRLDLGPRKQRAVLAVLLLHANRVIPTDRLIDELWGERPPETARAALQGYVAGLRKALGDGQASLATRSPGYVLEVDPGALDLDRFEKLRREAQTSSDPGRKAALLHDALALWRDVPLTEFEGEPFAEPAAEQLEERRLGALEERIDADLALGRHSEVITELHALVGAQPYRERPRAQLMLALYRSGRQADALAAYRAAREEFASGLGLEPGPELRALERSVLEQGPELDLPPSVVEPPGGAGRPGRRRRRIAWAVAAGATAAVAVVALGLLASRDAAPIVAEPNSVAIIDAGSRRVVATVSVGARPGATAADKQFIWVANLEDGSLTRIDAETRRVMRNIPLPATPNGVAVGYGYVWVVHGRLGRLSRVDPAFNRVTETVPIGPQAIRYPTGSVTTGRGSVWAVFGDSSLARVDPRSPRASTSTDTGVGPAAVVVFQGAVWVANAGSANVQRFSPLTLDQGPVKTHTVGSVPSGLAAGAGSVWVSNAGDDTVHRIDQTSTSARTMAVGDRPSAIAFGAGAAWVANRDDGTVSRIDARTNDVTTLDVGGAPSGIAVRRDEVWVAVQ